MSSLEHYIYLIVSSHGLVLAFLLAFDKTANYASRLLALIILIAASELALQGLLRESSIKLNTVYCWLIFLPAFAGPFSFLYCKAALLDSKFSRNDLIIFLPSVLTYLLVIDFLTYRPSAVTAWALGEEGESWRLQASENMLFLQAFVFVIAALMLVLRYREKSLNSLSSFQPSAFQWVGVLQLLSLTVWIINALNSYFPLPHFVGYTSNLILIAFIYFIGFVQWRKPKFFMIPLLSASIEQSSRDEKKQNTSGKTELPEDLRETLYHDLVFILESKKLYRNSALTLTSLAEEVGLTRHQLSELINRQSGKNFYEFINQFRVKDVCVTLREEEKVGNILAIAMDAGFSSKSTFNNIFKKITGMTPSQYRNNQ